jgi:hypothetical protein
VLTNTLAVPRAADALLDWTLAQAGNEAVVSVNPVVGETNDSWLNDIRRRAVTADHVLAALACAADGPVAETLCEALVTYVYPNGFFLQAGPTGPAIGFYEGTSWTPDVAVGDRLTVRVTELGSFHGTKQVAAHEPVTIVSRANPVDGLIQDLSAGVAPAEDLESELVRVTDATVTAVAGRDVTISYGTATGVALRVQDSAALCVGAVLDLGAADAGLSCADGAGHRVGADEYAGGVKRVAGPAECLSAHAQVPGAGLAAERLRAALQLDHVRGGGAGGLRAVVRHVDVALFAVAGPVSVPVRLRLWDGGAVGAGRRVATVAGRAEYDPARPSGLTVSPAGQLLDAQQDGGLAPDAFQVIIGAQVL